MTTASLYMLAGMILFVLGLYGLINYRHLLRKIIAVNILGSGVFMLLIAGAYRLPKSPDPIPHALVLTGIVVAVSATTLALALVVHLYIKTGQTTLPDEDQTKER